MEKLHKILKKYPLVQKITVGQGGAYVYKLADQKILKHICRASLPAENIWEAYVREACFYESTLQKDISWLPEVFAIERNEDEILLLMKEYHMMAHEEVTGEMLRKILAALASVHASSIPEFLKRKNRKPVCLSEKEMAASLQEWQAVLEEHEQKDGAAILGVIARRLNELNQAFFQNEARLIHGDFHCNNLLLDDKGMIKICDWQNCTVGDGMEDLSFLISRLLADGFSLEERKLVELYCEEAQRQGIVCQAKEVEKKLALADLNTSFILWPTYLHSAPAERVQSIYHKMKQDMDILLA